MQLRTWLSHHPIHALIFFFVAWKSLILLIAACSPGLGYDTSTDLLLTSHIQDERLPKPFRYMIGKLVRWDAIYFVQISNRGYLYEQEWAFGWGFTRFIALSTKVIKNFGTSEYEGLEGVVAIIIAHSSHLLSSLVLFKLTAVLFPGSLGLAISASFLHIISPAGIFLSAPYAESSCALLSFSGCLLFVKSLGSGKQHTLNEDVFVFISGTLFGVATTFRSNGILFGSLLLEDAFRTLFLFRDNLQMTTVRRLVATGFGGLSVALGFLLPQYIAYTEYCSLTTSRPWCENTLPSIYTFVQDRYWNVGVFRYWTLSNMPLFLLAAPVSFILIVSGQWGLRYRVYSTRNTFKKGTELLSRRQQVIRNLALSQLALTLLTWTTAHVQIITRVSSAYPVWVWYLATLCKEGTSFGKSYVSFMVIYGLVQAGLFASFLPPA